jgi:hypothetical protein
MVESAFQMQTSSQSQFFGCSMFDVQYCMVSPEAFHLPSLTASFAIATTGAEKLAILPAGRMNQFSHPLGN